MQNTRNSSLPKNSEFAIGFRNWLKSKTASSRSETQADQIISRASKFFKSITNDDLSCEEVTENTVIDFYLGSGRNIKSLLKIWKQAWKWVILVNLDILMH